MIFFQILSDKGLSKIIVGLQELNRYLIYGSFIVHEETLWYKTNILSCNVTAQMIVDALTIATGSIMENMGEVIDMMDDVTPSISKEEKLFSKFSSK